MVSEGFAVAADKEEEEERGGAGEASKLSAGMVKGTTTSCGGAAAEAGGGGAAVKAVRFSEGEEDFLPPPPSEELDERRAAAAAEVAAEEAATRIWYLAISSAGSGRTGVVTDSSRRNWTNISDKEELRAGEERESAGGEVAPDGMIEIGQDQFPRVTSVVYSAFLSFFLSLSTMCVSLVFLSLWSFCLSVCISFRLSTIF